MAERYEVVELGGAPVGVGRVNGDVHEMLCNAVLQSGFSKDVRRAKEHCQQIATALNAHDALVEACKGTLTYLEHPEGRAPNGWRLITAMEALRAALALANKKGGE